MVEIIPAEEKSKLGMKPGGGNHPCGRKKLAWDETERKKSSLQKKSKLGMKTKRQQRVEHAGLRTGGIDIDQWRVPFGESREGGFSEGAAGSAGDLLRTLEADSGQLRV